MSFRRRDVGLADMAAGALLGDATSIGLSPPTAISAELVIHTARAHASKIHV